MTDQVEAVPAGYPYDPNGSDGRMREFCVRPCLNGYIVSVGCQTVVFRRGEEDVMADEIAAYAKNPRVTTARYMKEAAWYNAGA